MSASNLPPTSGLPDGDAPTGKTIAAGTAPSDSARPIFVARGLCKTYGSGDTTVHALRDLDLDIYQGEFVVLLGPSGSGKSTCSTSWEASTRRLPGRRPGATTS